MTQQEIKNTFGDSDKSSENIGVIARAFITTLIFVFAIPLTAYVVWANAYVGSTLWAWFIVPTFGLSALTLPQAWGISLIVCLWTKQMFTCKSKDERTTAEKIGEVIGVMLWPWVLLFFGWVCHHFFMLAK